MKLIVGLGNPGKEYELTRHNMGFLTIDKLADEWGVDVDKKYNKGLFQKVKYFDEDVYLLKPQTFMNLSGTSVSDFVSYFRINLEDIVVVYDELALPPGKIRLRLGGSSGGHKGMQNIIDQLKTDKIKRIRIGVGEPQYNVIDYVLSKPSKEDQDLINLAIEKAVEAIKDILKNDFHHAMSKYN